MSEAKFYPELIQRRHIQYITRYDDDVFIIYDGANTTVEDIFNDHNSMHHNMRCNIEIEHDDCISFLDLNLPRNSIEIIIGIHRKPTYTDLVIPATSNHPVQHKMAAFTHMLDRVNYLPLSREENLKK
jgi:hypothetical protein